MRNKMNKSLRVFILLVSFMVIAMMIITPFIYVKSSENYNNEFNAIQSNVEMYNDSTELFDETLAASQIYYIDMINASAENDRAFINTLFVDGDQISDADVVRIKDFLDNIRSENSVYNNATYYISSKNEITGEETPYGSNDLAPYAESSYDPPYDGAYYVAYQANEQGSVSLIQMNIYHDDIAIRYKEQVKNIEEEILTNTNIKVQFKDIKNVKFVIHLGASKLGSNIYISDVNPNSYISSSSSYLTEYCIFAYFTLSIVLFGMVLALPIKKMQESKVIHSFMSKKGFLVTTVGFIVLLSFTDSLLDDGLGDIITMECVNTCYSVMLFTLVGLFALMTNKVIHRKKDENAMEKESKLYRRLSKIEDVVYRLYVHFTTIDFMQNNNRQILFFAICNAFVFFVLCCIGVLFGSVKVFLVLLPIYSVVIFIIIRSYLKKMQRDYHALCELVLRTAKGEHYGEIEEDLGMFESMKDSLQHLQDDFHDAVEQEVQSQKMKTELITNVSHDLKTPLTSMISYIDLLKDDTLGKEDQSKYIHILDNSANRLKHLIENLFEISKANSGNVEIDRMDVDLISLIKQVEMECDTIFKKKQLTMRYQLQDEKIIVSLDSQKTYRIFENLMGNVGKYAMKHTRVYINVQDYGNMVEISIKNMSATELDFDPDEIMERFTRGDKSRNSEGSGLGLAIAKSFTELQNGMMKIVVDGDLFKVVLRFYREEK